MQDGPEKKVVSDATQRAWVALQIVGPVLHDRVNERLSKQGMPDLAAYSILWAIDRAGEPIRPKDLGLLLFLRRYQVSRQIDRLVSAGLVIKQSCPNDARGHHLSLTDKGARMRRDMWAIYGPAMAEVMAPLTDEEATQIADLLGKLR